jgi:4-amino-4-deoxy-L-arabinose transferase-like glycosyltransferase
MRLPAALCGSGAIVAVAAVGKQLFTRSAGAVAATLTALSVWEVAWSRQARMYTALQFGFWLTIYCYLRFRRAQHSRWWWLAAVTASTVFTVGVHEFGWLIPVVILLHYGVDRLWAQSWSWRSVVLFCGTAVGLVTAAVLIFRYGFHQPVPVNYWLQNPTDWRSGGA